MKKIKLLILFTVIFCIHVKAQVTEYRNVKVKGINLIVPYENGKIAIRGFISTYETDSVMKSGNESIVSKEEYNVIMESFSLKNSDLYENYINNFLFPKLSFKNNTIPRKFGIIIKSYINSDGLCEELTIRYTNAFMSSLTLEDIADMFIFIKKNCKWESNMKVPKGLKISADLNIGYSKYSNKLRTMNNLKQEIIDGNMGNDWDSYFFPGQIR